MCVTNTTSRRPQPVTFNQNQVSVCPSLLTQKLLGHFALPSLSQEQAFTANPDQSVAVNSHNDKPRPKRRRKPQKPGKTAKNNDRHFVVHNYHDHSYDQEGDVVFAEDIEDLQQHRRRGGVSVPFPIKLHSVLDQVEADGISHVISWQPHGRCFVIHHPKEFVDYVMPKYFRQSKLTSFQRQLNLYGFQRLTRGPDAGGYYNELFLRGKAFLCKRMIRIKVKGTKFKAASSPEQEPDFYSMPPVAYVSPHQSDEETSVANNSTMVMDSSPSTCYRQQPLVVSYEPLPIQYQQPVAVAPATAPQQHYYDPQPPTTAQSTYDMASAQQPQVSEGNSILDEAVDELFLSIDNDPDILASEFASSCWDPLREDNFGMSVLEDDTQLGYMLEKLLAD